MKNPIAVLLIAAGFILATYVAVAALDTWAQGVEADCTARGGDLYTGSGFCEMPKPPETTTIIVQVPALEAS